MNTQGIDPAEEDEFAERLVKKYVIKRRGLPSDIAAMCTFLASPQAEWITGQTYPGERRLLLRFRRERDGQESNCKARRRPGRGSSGAPENDADLHDVYR